MLGGFKVFLTQAVPGPAFVVGLVGEGLDLLFV